MSLESNGHFRPQAVYRIAEIHFHPAYLHDMHGNVFEYKKYFYEHVISEVW